MGFPAVRRDVTCRGVISAADRRDYCKTKVTVSGGCQSASGRGPRTAPEGKAPCRHLGPSGFFFWLEVFDRNAHEPRSGPCEPLSLVLVARLADLVAYDAHKVLRRGG